MTFLASTEREQRQSLQVGSMGPGTFQVGGPAAFEGFGTATALGIGRGLATTGAFLTEVSRYTPAYRMQESLSDLLGVGDAFRENEARADEAIRGAIDYYRLDPATTGWAGQITYGAGSVLLPAVIGSVVAGPVGGAALAGGAVGTGTFVDMTGEGVDRDTALRAAGIDALATAVGVALPASIGTSLLAKVTTGAALNVGAGMGQRYAMGEYMRSAGYGEIAARYDAMDATAVATDVILGAAFGVLPGGRPSQQAVDAAMVSRSARHTEVDVAPGIPADRASLNQHVRAVDAAEAALLRGEQPSVDAMVRGARFAPKPDAPMPEVVALVQELDNLGFSQLVGDIRELEAELQGRGRAFDEDALPDVSAIPRAPEPQLEQAANIPPADPEIPANALHPRSELGRFMQQLRAEIGWQERGGKMIRGGEVNTDITAGVDFGRAGGEVVGRTQWVPKSRVDGQGDSTMWAERPVKITEAEANRALDKFAAGEKLTKRERGFIEYLAETARRYDAEREADAFEREAADIGADIERRRAEREQMRAMAEDDIVAEIIAERPDMELPASVVRAVLQEAWHGSPYRGIEQTGFSLSKVGTGEGSQVFGWGLYYAEAKAVGESYRATLAPQAFPDGDPRNGVAHILAAKGDEAEAFLRKNYANYGDKLDGMIADARAANLERGQLYAVKIPGNEVLLDWDAPLSKQPEAVKAALRSAGINPEGAALSTGRELIKGNLFDPIMKRAGFNPTSQKARSEFLASIGIPGLRYLDGNSRSDGQGTRNFVIWDEAAITDVRAEYPTAADALAAADEAVNRATIDSAAYQAAVNCFLRNG